MESILCAILKTIETWNEDGDVETDISVDSAYPTIEAAKEYIKNKTQTQTADGWEGISMPDSNTKIRLEIQECTIFF